ncbi:hypothetical protein D9753_35000 [Streptomyces dangxiongensis]|uniref:Uncharacterized protein n=1 Tax=Streptomyces dangxiongensis TaxID=1442032 RepID=A0A3G2JQN1_9ACTN|nr:hypothetical protein D9753_35000 [Streptomyces dangxiongensis]
MNGAGRQPFPGEAQHGTDDTATSEKGMSETPDRPTRPERTAGAGRRSAGAVTIRAAAGDPVAGRRTTAPGDDL